MRKLLALRSVTFKTFGLALAGALLALSACSTEEGVTPRCVQDVNANGNQHLETGCNQFARCEINGEVRPAEECCAEYKEQLFDLCMYGYGEFDLENNNGSGGMGGMGGSGGSGGMGGGGS
jgi:uncharacterized membrane protein YgcG